jgi:dipeptidyl aminopeptidase/acylaminoacyl peptidase
MGNPLAALLAVTFVESLVSAPRGDRVAWVEYERGSRSVWTAAAPGFVRRELARFDGDDGQELSQLVFSHDGASLYFVRGGERSPEGWHPNPASLVQPVQQAIWHVALTGGPPQVVAEGASPVPDPVGKALAFQREGRWLTLPVSHPESGRAKPTSLFEARGGISELAWAPDGESVTFVSARGRYSLIGLYRLGDPAIRWVAPEVSRDRRPVWSPDGSAIAWLRFPGAERNEFFDFARGSAFSVWIYDVARDAAREAWRSRGEDGDRNTDLHWMAGRALLVDSEQDGWRRAYRIDLEDGALAPLMPGGCELFGRAVLPRDASVVLSTNCGDGDRRHLALVAASGSRTSRLTRGAGMEVEPTLLASGRYVAYIGSTVSQPPALHVLDLESGRVVTRPRPPRHGVPSGLVEPRRVAFPSAAEDKAIVHGQILEPLPDSRPTGKRPAIVFLHGGPAFQTPAAWSGPRAGFYYALNQYFVSRGYVVLVVNYRASEGYGKHYRTAGALGARGALESLDVLGGARYLKERSDVDASRVGVYGESFGGNVASMVLARHSEVFAAGVSIHGYVDYVQRAEDYMPGGGWGIVTAEDGKLAAASSPATYADTWRSPTLFIHGDDDRNVEFSHTVSIVTRLRRLGAPVEVMSLPDEGHGFLRHASREKAFQRAADFLDDHLAPAKSVAASSQPPKGFTNSRLPQRMLLDAGPERSSGELQRAR